MTRSAYNRLRRKVAKATGRKLPACPKGMNANEQRFNRTILESRGNYEPKMFEITDSGKIYTPDFAYAGPCSDLERPRVVFIEVKGTYRSKKDEKLICERSRLAWEVAGDRNCSYDWVWAKYRRGGYECELRRGGVRERTVAFCRNNAEFEGLLNGGVSDGHERI